MSRGKVLLMEDIDIGDIYLIYNSSDEDVSDLIDHIIQPDIKQQIVEEYRVN